MRTIHLVLVVTAFAAAAALFIGAAVAHPPDPTRLPLGDTRLAKEPKAGWIWPCRVNPQAGGAHAQGR